MLGEKGGISDKEVLLFIGVESEKLSRLKLQLFNIKVKDMFQFEKKWFAYVKNWF